MYVMINDQSIRILGNQLTQKVCYRRFSKREWSTIYSNLTEPFVCTANIELNVIQINKSYNRANLAQSRFDSLLYERISPMCILNFLLFKLSQINCTSEVNEFS